MSMMQSIQCKGFERRVGTKMHVFSVALACVLACAFACALAAGLATPSHAYASDKDATLTLVVKHTENGTTKKISGMEFTAYQVATLDAGNRYQTLSAYKSVSIDFNKNVSASAMLAAAKSMAAIAAKSGSGVKKVTDSNGQAAFGTLDKGVYLVVNTGATGVAAGYNELAPFLINVPQFTDDGVVYDVVAEPKPELKKESTTTTTTTTTATSGTPKTGDLIDWRILGGCAVVGLLAMFVAIVAARRCRKQ